MEKIDQIAEGAVRVDSTPTVKPAVQEGVIEGLLLDQVASLRAGQIAVERSAGVSAAAHARVRGARKRIDQLLGVLYPPSEDTYGIASLK